MKPEPLRKTLLRRPKPAAASAVPGQRLFDRADRARDIDFNRPGKKCLIFKLMQKQYNRLWLLN
jgi:hypothetical protein